MAEGKRYFLPLPPFIGGGEREGLGGPLRSATYADVGPESVIGGVHQSPLLWVADVWAVVGI
jgi:hypothetical protein